MTTTRTIPHASLRRRTAALGLAVALAAAGCGPRGALTVYPDAAGVGSVQPIFVATSRRADGDANTWAYARSEQVSFARFDVSVPPNREPGTVTFPTTAPPDATTDFLTVGARNLGSERNFVAAINARLPAQPSGRREVTVFTHGFNTNFSEGLYRHAQMAVDFASPALAVHYSWPSAATLQGYGFDRESAIFARDGMQATLNALARSNAEGIIVAAHSMGAMVLMEALRTMAVDGSPAFFGKLQAVVLMAPDLDIEVFRGQLRPLADRKVPIYIFISSRDRALRASSFLRGQDARLGSIRDLKSVSDFDITFIDTSDVNDSSDALGHFAVATSPAMISMMAGLDRLGGDIFADAEFNPNAFESTVNVFQGVTDVVLTPLAQ